MGVAFVFMGIKTIKHGRHENKKPEIEKLKEKP